MHKVIWIGGLATAMAVVGGLVVAERHVEPTERPATLSAVSIGDDGGAASVDLSPGAVSALRQHLDEHPNDVSARIQLGSVYTKQAAQAGDPAAAAAAGRILRTAVSQSPDDVNAINALGVLSLQLHQFQQALEQGRKSRAKNPYKAYTYGIIGDAFTELGQYDSAIVTLQKMVDLRPDQNSYSRISYQRELHGDLPGATKAMEEAVDAGALSSANTQWCRVHVGDLYLSQGNLDKASAAYRQVLAFQSDEPHAVAGLARVAAARGDLDGAIAGFRKATATLNDSGFLVELGDLLTLKGDTVAARAAHESALKLEHRWSEQGTDTDLEVARFNAEHGRDLAATLERVKSLIQRRPTIYAEDALAWTLFKLGRAQEAAAPMARALRLGTTDAMLFYHAGRIAEACGKPVEAAGWMQKALTVNPVFSPQHAPEARATLARLRRDPAVAAALATAQP